MKQASTIAKLVVLLLANAGAAAAWYFWKDNFDLFFYEELLWGLFIIPLISLWYFFKKDNISPEIRISSLQGFDAVQDSPLALLRHVLMGLRLVAFAFLILAFARPQMNESEESLTTNGIDIVMALDLSSSMLAQDLKPNRLEASKAVGAEFIEARGNDRFGLVCYAGNARTLSPLTTDHAKVRELIGTGEVGMLEDGTAIGLGLGYAVNRLRDSEAPSKVIILLTDGENNVRSYPPITYAETAKQFGVKVYTIGVGTKGVARGPVSILNGKYIFGDVEVNIDEETLTEIANLTGGKYFRATDNAKLKSIYAEIDQLEKAEIEKSIYYNPEEKFFVLALIACCLLLAEFILKHTLFRSAT